MTTFFSFSTRIRAAGTPVSGFEASGWPIWIRVSCWSLRIGCRSPLIHQMARDRCQWSPDGYSGTRPHKFLIVEEPGSHKPTSNLPTMRRLSKLPFVLSVAETEALLKTAHTLEPIPQWGLYRQAGDTGRAALFETLYADLCLGYARQVMHCRCPPMQHFQVPACCWQYGYGRYAHKA